MKNTARIARGAPQPPLPPPRQCRLECERIVARPVHATQRGTRPSAAGNNAGRISGGAPANLRLRGRQMPARQRAHVGKAPPAAPSLACPAKISSRLTRWRLSTIERHIKLAPRRMARKAVQNPGDRVGYAGIQASPFSLAAPPLPQNFRRDGKQRRLRLDAVNFQIGRGRHRLVIEIESCAHRSSRSAGRRQCRWRASVSRNAAATGCAAASPPRSPESTSRHHCRRISPGIGSRAKSRTRAISTLKA